MCVSSTAFAKEPPNNLKADNVVYDKTKNTIIATGHVKIHYNGNYATSDALYYNKNNQKIWARGHVTLIDSKHNTIYSDKLDLSKDLKNGIIKNLKAKTNQDTYFSSQTAKRIDNGSITIFNNATYTACKSCDFKQSKSCKTDSTPNQTLWRIRAKKIIWNSTKKTLAFKHSHFDVLDHKLISMPNFTIPDYSVKRYSGFLSPSISYNNYLGYSLTGKYFFNLAPSYDLTLEATKYTKQSFMGIVNWRQALDNGYYFINLAYANQNNPLIFPKNTIDAQSTHRFMLGSKGDFTLNKYWSYGWNLLYQSDGDFAYSYNIKNYNDYDICSSLYLRGLSAQNFFNLNFYNFTVQDAYKKSYDGNQHHKYNELQPWVLPQLDYNYILPKSVLGGRLQVNTNLRAVYRNKKDSSIPSLMSGASTHLSSEINWQKIFTNKFGISFNPILALRGDTGTIYRTRTHIEHGYASSNYALATAGLEVKYPLAIKSSRFKQIIEPTAQIFLRNNINENKFLPNENAQAFNFNAFSLFKRDKFSGTDRTEYGSRLNLGLRYSSTLNNNLNIYALGGRSIQLSHDNPFLKAGNLENNFCASLANKYSDFVSAIQINSNNNLQLTFRNRFSPGSFKLNDNEIDFSKSWKHLSLNAYYFSLNKQLGNKSYAGPNQQLANSADVSFNKNWQISLYDNFDLSNRKFINIGSDLRYQNDCVAVDLIYMHDHPISTNLASNSFAMHISLRTLFNANQE